MCAGLGRSASELWPHLQAPVVSVLQLISKASSLSYPALSPLPSVDFPQAPVAMFSAAMCFLPRIVDLGPACLHFTFPVLDCLLSSATDCSRFSRVLSLMSQISCLYKADVFPPLVLLATNAQFRCQAVVGAPQVLPTSHASRSHVTSEVQREAAEAYSTMMLLMCNMMATAPAGSFADPAVASLLVNFVATASAVARHTCDVPCLKQSLALSRRALDQVPSSPPLQAALPQVIRRACCPVATLTVVTICHCSWWT